MALRIFTDSSANLPEEVLQERDIRVVSLTVNVGGEERLCYEPGASFDADGFYGRLREDRSIELKTSMINETTFAEAFEPCLAAGDDVLYVAMSSGISGTFSAGEAAVQTLSETYPERAAAAVDTRAASLGEGLQVLEAADHRDAGKSISAIVAFLNRRREQMRQFFLVDDLMFLKRGGRISGSAALAGTIVNLKPVLKGNEEGRIVLAKKTFGRRRALGMLVEIFEQGYAALTGNRAVGIAHAGSGEDAQWLKDNITSRFPETVFTIVGYEPGTGVHVGPGAVALFFWGA